MAQVTTSAVSNEILASQRELLARMGEVATVTEANTQAILALGERVNSLESGSPRHEFTPAQEQAPRGIAAPVSTLFGKELEVSKPRSARTVSEGEQGVCQTLFADLRLREQHNRASKGGKALLFVFGPLQQDKSRVQGPSMYWDLKNALDSDLINGRKLTTDEVSVFGQIVTICEEPTELRTIDVKIPLVSTYEGATQKVKAFLKRNK